MKRFVISIVFLAAVPAFTQQRPAPGTHSGQNGQQPGQVSTAPASTATSTVPAASGINLCVNRPGTAAKR